MNPQFFGFQHLQTQNVLDLNKIQDDIDGYLGSQCFDTSMAFSLTQA